MLLAGARLRSAPITTSVITRTMNMAKHDHGSRQEKWIALRRCSERSPDSTASDLQWIMFRLHNNVRF